VWAFLSFGRARDGSGYIWNMLSDTPAFADMPISYALILLVLAHLLLSFMRAYDLNVDLRYCLYIRSSLPYFPYDIGVNLFHLSDSSHLFKPL
jgi:hypothetical protein